MIRKVTFLLVILFNLSAIAQNLIPVTTLPVFNYGREIVNPWAGGLNNPELSSINLNRDSYNDLFIFDKDGYKITTFLNVGQADSPLFVYSPRYQKNFPELTKLALIRDYDKDGVDDIFTSATAGLKILKGNYMGGSNFVYQVIDSPIVFYTSGFEVNLYNANDDIPAIRDVDNDGDVDILVNSIFGQSYEYYKNKSVELYGHPDTSVYELNNTCWGRFLEDPFNNKLLLGACKSDMIEGSRDTTGSYRHSGCTLELFDQDNDLDADFLMGDPSFKTIVYGKNGGDATVANLISEDSIFPFYNVPINMSIFPAIFSLDVNNDNKDDIIAAPNIQQISLDIGNVWYYKNVGPDTNAHFELHSDSFIVGEMIDAGKNSKPTFFDYDGDGLVDILISNEGYFNKSTLVNESKLTLYKNIGTIDSPKFEIITRDYQSLFALGLLDMKHTLGDIDGDGDLDMFIGDNTGQINLFFNTPSAGIANFTSTAPMINFKNIDVGQKANPFLFDVDKDGDLDLLIGRQDGKVSYYWNHGTPTAYRFNKDSVNSNFGRIDVSNSISSPDGNASVFAKDSLLYVGSQYGTIQEFVLNTDSLLSGSLLKLNNEFGQIRDGYNSNIVIQDINNDGILEYMTGNSRGGITMYSEADWDTIISPRYFLYAQEQKSDPLNLQIYPNPASNLVSVSFPSYAQSATRLQIYNINAQLVFEMKINDAISTFSVADLSSGVYYLKLENAKNSATKKLVIYK